ncbi:hypothetical protein [Hoeflea sp.]|uniref:hypothetical protein n=1 Tax=Hoeflea sp. TaxID=1940281 RepID=UPI003A93A142
MVFIAWIGIDEMEGVNGDGRAGLLDGGFMEVTFNYQADDEAVLKAMSHSRDGSSVEQVTNSDD